MVKKNEKRVIYIEQNNKMLEIFFLRSSVPNILSVIESFITWIQINDLLITKITKQINCSFLNKIENKVLKTITKF